MKTDYECHRLDNQGQVFFYENDFYILSNFSAFNLRWRGLTFPTSEHAYHWEKFRGNPIVQDYILGSNSAHEAFRIAQEYKPSRRKDWENVKVMIMKEILREKMYQHEYVKRKLLVTGSRELIEDSWRDDFWGWGGNKNGENIMGKLWMELRSELLGVARDGQEGRLVAP